MGQSRLDYFAAAVKHVHEAPLSYTRYDPENENGDTEWPEFRIVADGWQNRLMLLIKNTPADHDLQKISLVDKFQVMRLHSFLNEILSEMTEGEIAKLEHHLNDVEAE